jgi:cytoskeletal protein CcmA (bactofilin family)
MSQQSSSKSLHIDKRLTSLELTGGRECDPYNPQKTPDLFVYGGMRVMKNSCLVGDLNLGGDLHVQGNLSVFGNTFLNDLYADDIFADVVTARELVGNISCDCKITANSIEVKGPLTVTGDLCANGNLKINGDLDLNGNLSVASLVVGDLTLNGNLVVNDVVTGNIQVIGDMCATGNLKVNGAVNTMGNINISGGEVVTGDLVILGNLTGNISLSGGTVNLNPVLIDALGGQRVTTPYTLFDSMFLTSKRPDNWDETLEVSGSSTFFPSYITLRVTGAGDRVVRQSRQYLPYQPGKGLRILCTGTLIDALTPNVVSRIGFFDDANDKDPLLDTEASGNGHFFEWDGTTVNIVERSFISGSQVDTKVPQAMWNIDRFDGTGPSGIVLDITKRQIFMFELQWLGVGTVVAALVINRTIYWAHIIQHANLSTQLPYTSRPTLPVRYELSSLGGMAQLQQICCSVISDGGYTPRGSIYSRSMGASSDVSVSGGHQALIALRLKATHIRTTLNIMKTTILATSGNDFYVVVYRFLAPLDPFSGTATWNSAGPYSAAEYAIQNTGLTMTFTSAGGILLDETYVSNHSSIGGSALADRFAAIVTGNIAGVSDIIVVAAGPDMGVKAAAAIQWQELE